MIFEGGVEIVFMIFWRSEMMVPFSDMGALLELEETCSNGNYSPCYP
jgi:hypothetical protein